MTELHASSSLIPVLPFAHVFGEPVLTCPQDLFIPPDALQLFLDSFEGPLDLLLYLIRRQNLNVLDIPMAQVTAQYMRYIETMKAARLELAAEYLLMAALLIEIKSRLLLPRHQVEEGVEPEDPRAELIRRLLEYEQIKLAALALDKLPQAERDFAWLSVLFERDIEAPLPDVNPADLRAAWMSIMARAKNMKHHQIRQDQLSVREQMGVILRRLEGKSFVAFERLFAEHGDVAHLVVNFIAILELAKEGLLMIVQDGDFQPIYVRLV